MSTLPPGLFNPIFQESIVKVTQLLGDLEDDYAITWPKVDGATGYNVYASASPLFTNNKVNTAPITATTYSIEAVHDAPDVVVHVWVEAILVGGNRFLQDLGATVYDAHDTFNTSLQGFGETGSSAQTITIAPASLGQNLCQNTYDSTCGRLQIDEPYMKFIRDEIRRRAKTMLENDGEVMILYQRKWRGAPCKEGIAENSLVQGTDPDLTADPSYDHVATRCQYCFGTGIYGGFWPGIPFIARYGNIPRRLIKPLAQGIDVQHDFNSWSLWLPKLHKHDLIVRTVDGQHYIVDDIGQSEWRTIPLHQEFKMLNLQEGDIRDLVTDAAIQVAEQRRIDRGFVDQGF